MDLAAKLILEGGAIDVDGQGTLIATEESVLHENRRASIGGGGGGGAERESREVRRAAVEEAFLRCLGVEKVIWLPWGVAGDFDTNGHVDNMCRFVRAGEVVLREFFL